MHGIMRLKEVPSMDGAQTFQRRTDKRKFKAIQMLIKDRTVMEIRILPIFKKFETEVPVKPTAFTKDSKGKLHRMTRKVPAKEIISGGSMIRLKNGDRFCCMDEADGTKNYFGVDFRLWENYVVYEKPKEEPKSDGTGKEAQPAG